MFVIVTLPLLGFKSEPDPLPVVPQNKVPFPKFVVETFIITELPSLIDVVFGKIENVGGVVEVSLIVTSLLSPKV